MDTSVKNNIVTSISHTHIHNKPVTKTPHYAVNVMSTEAELFTIRYGINQATKSNDISKIIVVTNSIHAVKKIFNSSSHPFQSHVASIFNKLQIFFSCYQENSIKFWECTSQCNWSLHKVVNMETKSFNPILLFPYKLSQNFNKKNKYDDLANRQRIIFQVLDLKRKHFLDLVSSDNNIIELSYIKGSSQLKHFGHSNSLCARALRAITNHTPICEYRLRFFPMEDFSCSYGLYPIETR